MGSARLGPRIFPCSREIQSPSVTQVAPVPALLPEGDGLMHTFSTEESVVHIHGFFPKTRVILVLRNGSALRSYGEQEHDHPIVLNKTQHRSEKAQIPFLPKLENHYRRSCSV